MPRMDWTGAADPYVVVTAQSEAGLQMFRCATAWDTLVRPPSPPLLTPAASLSLHHLSYCTVARGAPDTLPPPPPPQQHMQHCC